MSTVTVIAGLIFGFGITAAFAYHIERRFSDLRSEINHRLEDLYRYLDLG